MARGETIKKPIMYPEKKVKLTPIAFPSWMEFLDSVEAATMSVLKDENEILSLVEKSIISQDHVYLLHSFEPETLLTPSSSKKSVARWAHWSDAIYWHESHFSKRDLESSQHMFVVVGFFKSKSENFNIDKDHLENWSYLVVADLINGRVGSLDGLRILPFSYIMEQGIDLIKVEWVPFSKEGLF